MVEKAITEVFISNDGKRVFLDEIDCIDYECEVKSNNLIQFIKSKRNEFKLPNAEEVAVFVIIHIDDICKIMGWDIKDK